MIAVLDYGIGNLRSAEKALLRVGAEARLVDNPEEAMGASGVVLPGVGAFGACARALSNSGLDKVVRRFIDEGRPFLGICVGLQLLFEGSEEDPDPGLGVLGGIVRAIAASERRPQMQWNLVRRTTGRSSRLLGDGGSRWYYFVHSYTPVPEGSDALASVVGTCEYGGELAVAFERGNMFGTQFHPEKSASAGLELLARFARVCGETAREQ